MASAAVLTQNAQSDCYPGLEVTTTRTAPQTAVNPAELRELTALIRGGASLIVIETHDEPHALALFAELRRALGRPLFKWTATSGLEWVERNQVVSAQLTEPDDALNHIGRRRDQGIYLLLDFHPYLSNPVIVRHLRELARGGEGVDDRTLVLVSPEIRLPAELRAGARRFALKPPDAKTLEAMVREEAATWAGARGKQPRPICEDALQQLLVNLAGLSMKDARRLARNAIHDDGVLAVSDLPELMRAKFELLNPDGILGFEMETARFADVAGMPRLKRWLEQRAPVFAASEPPPGLDPPRGMLLLGVQGCGKSLAARAAAGLFGVPLLHLDFGALFNRYHGESERNLRSALAGADLMAPCVLWMDEIEKGLATSETDGGTSRRMLGTLLTWMAERTSRVFLAATANDISALPPELVRKGRFDEIFFVDLPDAETREAVLAIHLKRRQHKPELYPLDKLAAATEGFSGAELEHVIVAGLYTAHAEGERLSTEHLLAEIDHTRPLSVMMAESIDQLRAWAGERAVKA